MSRSRSFSTQAIVLKRVNTGESDRVVTLFTQDYGKLVCVAKGARKITSAKRALLEPGNLITGFFIKTKSLPLLTQVKLLDDHQQTKTSLAKLRQLTQVLEIIDRLFVEGQAEEELFFQIKEVFKMLNKSGDMTKQNQHNIKEQITTIINNLGYQQPTSDENRGLSLNDLVAEISERPMRSWEFLKVG